MTDTQKSVMDQVIRAEQGEFPGSEIEAEKMKIERENLSSSVVNPASRLANPVGMQGTPTMDRNLLARGQQLFTGPNEITFASKGGIMNSKKAFQRVA
jgi:hypothetical protein